VYNQKCGFNKLQFSDTKAILLTALVHGNDDGLTFEIMWKEICDDAAVVISDFLKSSKTLKNLNLTQNTISSEVIKEIMKAIKTNTILQILDISYNKISDNGAVAISELLKENNTLQRLSMSHNRISNNGIIDIGKGLQINTTLQMLDISYNSISDDGICNFSDYLKERTTLLQKLRISWNNIYFLDLNSTASNSFNISKKGFGNIGAILVLAFLQHNTNIQKLDISYT